MRINKWAVARAGRSRRNAEVFDVPMNPDVLFFREYPKRQARIRLPRAGEFLSEFRTLGTHHESRRRVLVWHCKSPGLPNGLMVIPFLLRADESVEDSDANVLGILKDLMDAEIARRAE